jgi:hypothetical protein
MRRGTGHVQRERIDVNERSNEGVITEYLIDCKREVNGEDRRRKASGRDDIVTKFDLKVCCHTPENPSPPHARTNTFEANSPRTQLTTNPRVFDETTN